MYLYRITWFLPFTGMAENNLLGMGHETRFFSEFWGYIIKSPPGEKRGGSFIGKDGVIPLLFPL